MKFAHHLSSHLTPEWRKHYIDYENLKERIYKMVGVAPKPEEGEEDEEEGEFENTTETST